MIPPILLIRADASARMGDGHVMRCLTLADEVRRRGGTVHFASASMPERLVQAVERAGHTVHLLAFDGEADGSDDSADWDRATWPSERQYSDALATAEVAARHGATQILVDHYRLDARFEAKLSLPIAVLDDLANRPHCCSLLIDHNLGRAAGDYAGLLSDDAAILVGPRFAALRPAFAAFRAQSMERRKTGGMPRRILISLGSTDVGGFTGRALSAARTVFGATSIDVVIRRDAPSRPAVDEIAATSPTVRVHDHVRDMASLMAASDLAIGAGGTTSWERCAVGLPAACLVVAHNQRFVAEQLAAAGAAGFVGDIADLEPFLREIAADPSRLERMSAAALAIVDGLGAMRIADRLLGAPPRSAPAELLVRPARLADSELLWLWRNDPTTRMMSQSTAAIRWPEHTRWLAKTLRDPARELYIIEANDTPVATVRFDRDDKGTEVSINLSPDARGRALAYPILDAACRDYRSRYRDTRLIATIRPGNNVSERIFARAGFRRTGDLSSTGFAHYVAKPAPQPTGAKDRLP